MKKHIVFDFDDTISSGYEHNQQLFLDTFLEFEKSIDEDFVRNLHFTMRGTSMIEQFEKVKEKFGLKVSVEDLVRRNEEMHKERAADMSIFGDIDGVLKHLKSLGKIVSLCTNRSKGSLDKILDKNQIGKYFDNVISCSDEGHEKPDPYCFEKLMEKYPEIKKDETIYFGDSKTDAEFATNAGVDFLVIDHYLNKKKFYTLIIDSFVTAKNLS